METIKLEEWLVIENPYTGESHLAGKVFGHPMVRDGLRIISSPIRGGSSKNKLIITASGSYYSLGEINEEYGKQYPDAEAQVWKAVLLMEIAKNAQNN